MQNRMAWLRIIAGVGGFALLLGMLPGCESGRPAKPPKMNVATLAPKAAAGVIARGTIGGRPWRVRLTLGREPGCNPRPGWAADCLESVGFAVRHWRQERPDPVSIWTFSPVLFGPVRSDVTDVRIRLSDGVPIDLHPVRAFGHRWIGVVLPPALTPVEARVYAGRRELTHAVPYVRDDPDGTPKIEFLSWLRPGDDGPTRMTKLVRGAGMSLVLHTGPWGNVLLAESAGWDFPLGFKPDKDPALEESVELPRAVPVAFASPARYMVLILSNRTAKLVQLVRGAGIAFAIVKVAARPAILRWDVYDAAWRRLSSGYGPPGGL